MAETKMSVTLLAHTQLSEMFEINIASGDYISDLDDMDATDGQAIALTAIRTCYSANKPSEIVAKEGAKYFGSKATDGEQGTEADRLLRMIFRSKHLSTVEHLAFTFAIEGVSRSLLAQLTRHRAGFSFSVQSQRYVKFGSDDRSGGFDYIVPDNITEDKTYNFGGTTPVSALEEFKDTMHDLQVAYDRLRDAGVSAEDARSVLPNAAACNLVMTVNLRSLLDFYSKRKAGRGGQKEITELAEVLRKEVVNVEPWTDEFFEEV